MERAGCGTAEWVWRLAGGRSVTVLCGPGNNGGDGYVIARELNERGLKVRVIAPIDPQTEAARAARSRWAGEVDDGKASSRGGVFVDCLFGSGLSRPLAEPHQELLARLADQHDLTVAVDLPSGIDADTGAILGTVPACDITIALGAWKPAHFLMPGAERMGTLKLVDIGIGTVPDAAHRFPRPQFRAPDRAAHKFTRGFLGVVAGAMPGASLLAAEAAMRSGAGYVKLLTAQPERRGPAALVIDTEPLETTLSDARWSALLVGPGLGRDDRARERLAAALERRVPIMLDADALHLIDDDLLEGIDPCRILVTPHEGELAKLCETFGITADGKWDRALQLAVRTGLTVLAKGADTIVCCPSGETAFFESAPSWLATAGSGDVLAGIAASRLATGLTPFAAAGEAVWLHGEAARVSGPALIADDLVDALPAAYARFL
jgi:hydroxyethylthiazole kinase-like uncharacterized protein yjeF